MSGTPYMSNDVYDHDNSDIVYRLLKKRSFEF